MSNINEVEFLKSTTKSPKEILSYSETLKKIKEELFKNQDIVEQKYKEKLIDAFNTKKKNFLEIQEEYTNASKILIENFQQSYNICETLNELEKKSKETITNYLS